ADVRPSLGRDLAGGARNVTVNLVAPGTLYGERANQLDIRVAKIVRIGRSRTNVGIDIYNAFNGHAPLTVNNSFGAWQQPTEILLARFVKLNVQFDFYSGERHGPHWRSRTRACPHEAAGSLAAGWSGRRGLCECRKPGRDRTGDRGSGPPQSTRASRAVVRARGRQRQTPRHAGRNR